jgi:hypothetical protein
MVALWKTQNMQFVYMRLLKFSAKIENPSLSGWWVLDVPVTDISNSTDGLGQYSRVTLPEEGSDHIVPIGYST